LFHDLTLFFKGHWPHILIAIPAAIGFTALHELAHCVAVWVQGGRVTEFAWLPTAAEWGHMRYTFPAGAHYSETAISLSPYVFWMAGCLLAWILARRRAGWPFWAASIIFVWLFIVPLADMANTVFPYVLGDAQNDLSRALGGPASPLFTGAVVVCGVLATGLGFALNRRLYRERAIGFPAYCVLAAAATLIVLAIST
jgi:hypothetical protein